MCEEQDYEFELDRMEYAPTHCSCGVRLISKFEQSDGICDYCFEAEGEDTYAEDPLGGSWS